MRAQRRFVIGPYAEADVIDIAPLGAGRGAAGTAELARHVHEIDERAAGAQLIEAEFLLPTLDLAAEYVAVEAKRRVEVGHSQNYVVDPYDSKR